MYGKAYEQAANNGLISELAKDPDSGKVFPERDTDNFTDTLAILKTLQGKTMSARTALPHGFRAKERAKRYPMKPEQKAVITDSPTSTTTTLLQISTGFLRIV